MGIQIPSMRSYASRSRKPMYGAQGGILWCLDISKMFVYASPRAAALAGPHIGFALESFGVAAQDLVPEWVAAISAAPHTEDVAGSVVDMLLHLAADPHLRPSIPVDVWSRLNERPSLPPACRGRYLGSGHDTVRTVLALDDIGVLTSYPILVWSEREPLDDGGGLAEMRRSIREDFSGVGNGYYREDFLQRLDYILGKLDRL